MEEMWSLVSDMVLLLLACLICGGIFSRLGQSPLVGYLLAGMFMGGPGSLHFIHSEHTIEAISELGVSLLLFSLGLEFSLSRLQKLGPVPLLGGTFQVVVSILVCGLVAWLARFPVTESIAIGAMVALSSTAIVLRTLMEKSELESPYGENSLAVLLIQDISVVPLAILISLLAGGQGPLAVAGNAGRILGVSLLLIFGLYVILNHVAFRALGTLTLERNRELTTILSVVTGLGSAWAADAAGISPALGAFVSGMFLGASPFATQIRADISPLRIVLLTLFFGSAGMIADPIWMMQNFALVAGTTTVIVLLKIGVILIVFLSLGNIFSVAMASAICLSQIGEFAFVLGNLALQSQVISESTSNLMISATILSLFVSPFLVGKAPMLANYLTQYWPGSRQLLIDDEHDSQHKPDVVIIGFGPAASFAGKVVAKSHYRTTVIDLNRSGVQKAMDLGFEGLVGDATQQEVLEHAHVGSAKVVVITIPSLRMAITVVDMIRTLAPQAHIVARARFLRDVIELYDSGADVVFGDEEEIGVTIGNHLTHWITEQVPPSQHEETLYVTDLQDKPAAEST